MVAGKHKSNSMRKVFKRTPGGKVVVRYEKRKPSKAKCGQCGDVLKGILRLRPTKMQNTPKTKKRPERPYGGNLCSSCTRRKIVAKVRE